MVHIPGTCNIFVVVVVVVGVVMYVFFLNGNLFMPLYITIIFSSYDIKRVHTIVPRDLQLVIGTVWRR